ncbi:MAG: hypothetical protein AAF798_05470 [Bacteroidota bacterium]
MLLIDEGAVDLGVPPDSDRGALRFRARYSLGPDQNKSDRGYQLKADTLPHRLRIAPKSSSLVGS